jgi:hypothetical protein
VKAWINEQKDIDESELYNFMINWVSFFTDLSIDELRSIPLNDIDSLNIAFLFKQTTKFLSQPPVVLDLKELKLGGKTYPLMTELRTITGAKMLFGNGSYRQWMLGNQLSKIVAENKNEKVVDGLLQLLAVLYTDGDESNEGIAKRIEAFKDLNVLNGWSAYFFFALLVKKYNGYFLSFTKDQLSRKAQSLLTLEQSKNKLSKTFIGKLLPLRLLSSEFLILDN